MDRPSAPRHVAKLNDLIKYDWSTVREVGAKCSADIERHDLADTWPNLASGRVVNLNRGGWSVKCEKKIELDD